MRAHGRRVLGTVAAVTMTLGALVATGGTAGAAGPAEVPGFSVSPGTLDFGDQTVGAASAPRAVTVDVPAGWSLADFQVAGGDAGDFDADDAQFQACASTPGPTKCTIDVTFTPGGTGSRAAKATLDLSPTPGGGGGPSESVQLDGKGVSPGDDPGLSGFSVSPGTLSFGDQPVGATSAPKTVTVDIPAGWSLIGFEVADGNVGDFDGVDAQVQACGNTPGPTQCAIGVTFTPGGTGSRAATGTFQIGPTPGGGGAQGKSVHLEGNGVSPGVGGAPGSVTPTTLDFGDVAVGAQPPAISYVTLSVPAGFEFVSEGVEGGGGQFHTDDASFDACWQKPGPLACHLGFTFSPGGTGVQTATANVDISPIGGGDAQDFFVTLRGTGVRAPGADDFSVSPTTVNFGSVPMVPTPPPSATATLNVPAGLELAGFGISGPDDEDFTVDLTSATGCVGVPGPVTCTANFTFSPKATGARSAAVTLDATPAGGGPAQDLSVTLQGTGVANPNFTVTPQPLDFFGVPLNANPPSVQYVTINIPEGWAFSDNGIDHPGGFGLDLNSWENCLGRRGPATCPIGFTFSPTVLGPQSATGIIAWAPVGGGLAQNVSFPLQGTGVAPGIGDPPSARPPGGGTPVLPALPAEALAAAPRFTG